jgi:hypothetical protein
MAALGSITLFAAIVSFSDDGSMTWCWTFRPPHCALPPS